MIAFDCQLTQFIAWISAFVQDVLSLLSKINRLIASGT